MPTHAKPTHKKAVTSKTSLSVETRKTHKELRRKLSKRGFSSHYFISNRDTLRVFEVIRRYDFTTELEEEANAHFGYMDMKLPQLGNIANSLFYAFVGDDTCDPILEVELVDVVIGMFVVIGRRGGSYKIAVGAENDSGWRLISLRTPECQKDDDGVLVMNDFEASPFATPSLLNVEQVLRLLMQSLQPGFRFKSPPAEIEGELRRLDKGERT